MLTNLKKGTDGEFFSCVFFFNKSGGVMKELGHQYIKESFLYGDGSSSEGGMLADCSPKNQAAMICNSHG